MTDGGCATRRWTIALMIIARFFISLLSFLVGVIDGWVRLNVIEYICS